MDAITLTIVILVVLYIMAKYGITGVLENKMTVVTENEQQKDAKAMGKIVAKWQDDSVNYADAKTIAKAKKQAYARMLAEDTE